MLYFAFDAEQLIFQAVYSVIHLVFGFFLFVSHICFIVILTCGSNFIDSFI